MVSLDIGKCSGSAETCPAVQQAFEADEFYSTVDGLEPNVAQTRQIFGDFVVACAKGTCPGQNLELTKQVLRSMLNPDND